MVAKENCRGDDRDIGGNRYPNGDREISILPTFYNPATVSEFIMEYLSPGRAYSYLKP